jgi:hypothetical protein
MPAAADAKRNDRAERGRWHDATNADDATVYEHGHVERLKTGTRCLRVAPAARMIER